MTRPAAGLRRRILERPAIVAVVGALAISTTGILVRVADQPPASTAFWRCLYALPVLGLLAWREHRAHGPAGPRRIGLALLAGAFFFVDLELWHHGIEGVGAGLSTVVTNLQVIVVGVLAWLLQGERPTRRSLVGAPLALVGIALISGVVGGGAYGDRPVAGTLFSLGTAVAYGLFLLTMRTVNRDLRGAATPLFWATASCAACSLAGGAALGELSWPDGEGHAWLLLLGLSAQVVGYFAIGTALPRLPAIVGSILLLTQPCVSVVLAGLLVDERPSLVQLAGVGLVLTALLVTVLRPRPRAAGQGRAGNRQT